jgi:hypothetical protein
MGGQYSILDCSWTVESGVAQYSTVAECRNRVRSKRTMWSMSGSKLPDALLPVAQLAVYRQKKKKKELLATIGVRICLLRSSQEETKIPEELASVHIATRRIKMPTGYLPICLRKKKIQLAEDVDRSLDKKGPTITKDKKMDSNFDTLHI